MPRAEDPLLAGLVDDAALFPPGNAAMPEALASHRGYRAAPWSAAVGPFLCPASRVDELLAVLPADQQIRLALVVDGAGDLLHQARRQASADPRVTLVALEVAHARIGDAAIGMGAHLDRAGEVSGFLEVARTGFAGSLDLIAGSGWAAAKLRTGGLTAEAFPTEREVADFLVACAERDLPFKLTAGLHHAVRGTTDGGLEQHGLLNVLVATRLATTGAGPADVAMVLAQRDPGPLVEMIGGWDDTATSEVRRSFRSFGCCGVTDPLDDLSALGLLEDYP